MHKLTLRDLWLILDNLVNFRMDAVRSLPMGDAYEARLRDLHQRIQQNPDISTRRPFSKEMAEADKLHDKTGRAIDLLLQAYETLSDQLSPETLQAVEAARTHVIAAPKETRASYLDQALNARKRRAKMDELTPILSTLALTDLGSLADLTETYTQTGESLDNLLHRRSQTKETITENGIKIRHESIALFLSIQKTLTLQEELGASANTQATERQIFGYTRALLQLRRSGDTTNDPADDASPSPENGTDPIV